MDPDTINTNLLTPPDAWFNAPLDRTPEFFQVFSRVARGLQESLRRLIPPVFFRDRAKFSDIEASYPILVYSSSRPFRCRPSAEFNHDVLNVVVMNNFYRLAHARLKERLEELYPLLLQEMGAGVARHYDPDLSRRIITMARTQLRFRRPISNMVVAENHLFKELLELREATAAQPKLRARKIVEFSKRWNSILRRFFGRNDLREAGPPVLEATTRILLEAQREYAPHSPLTVA